MAYLLAKQELKGHTLLQSLHPSQDGEPEI
jgi:hypothetical protein